MSIYTYKDGYRISVMRNGQRRTETLRGTLREAEIREAQIASELGMPDAYTTMTVREYWEEVFPHRLSNRGTPRSPVTLDSYRRDLERNVLPKIGSEQLRDLTHEQLAAVIRSSSSPNNTKKYLKGLLRSAYDDGLMPSKPLERRVRVEHRKAKRYQPWSIEEAQRALETIPSYDLELGLYLYAGLSGLRMEEALGLTWDAVAEATYDVRATYTDVGGWSSLMKNAHSRRLVPIVAGRDVIAIAKRSHLQTDSSLSLSETVREQQRLSEERMIPMRGDVLRAKWMRACEALGLRYIPPSNLRHTSDTIYLAAGVRGELNDKMHGRASQTVTYSSYYRPDIEEMERAARLVNEALYDVEK